MTVHRFKKVLEEKKELEKELKESVEHISDEKLEEEIEKFQKLIQEHKKTLNNYQTKFEKIPEDEMVNVSNNYNLAYKKCKALKKAQKNVIDLFSEAFELKEDEFIEKYNIEPVKDKLELLNTKV